MRLRMRLRMCLHMRMRVRVRLRMRMRMRRRRRRRRRTRVRKRIRIRTRVRVRVRVHVRMRCGLRVRLRVCAYLSSVHVSSKPVSVSCTRLRGKPSRQKRSRKPLACQGLGASADAGRRATLSRVASEEAYWTTEAQGALDK